VALRSAGSVEETLAMLDRLKELHQTSWRRRGQPGCFAAPWFESFHRDLIRARVSSGEIQLLAAIGRSAICTTSPTAIGSTRTRADSTTWRTDA
jgi:hypothetical protein